MAAALKRGAEPLNEIKRDYQLRFGINARQFNAIRISLEGKLRAAAESHQLHLKTLADQIQAIDATIAALDAKIIKARGDSDRRHRLREQRHGKMRRRTSLTDRRAASDRRGPHLTFGGGHLWHAQHDLEANGYDQHAAWLADWRQARSGQVILVGSKDETAGNQCAQLAVQPDGTVQLRLRVMPGLCPEFGPVLEIPGFRFWWTRRGNRTTGFRDHGENLAMQDLTAALEAGTAVTTRFVKQEGRWRIFVSVERQEVLIRTSAGLGAVAIDVNSKQLDWARVDADGNLMACGSHPIRHKSHACAGQVAASIGDAVQEMAQVAERHGVPLVTEKLDFTQKKRAMRDAGVRQRAMLSGFAYQAVQQAVASRCQRRGIEHRSVNPAFSSLIGCASYMSLYGMHSGTAAALVLARRALGHSERVPMRLEVTAPVRWMGGRMSGAAGAWSRGLSCPRNGVKTRSVATTGSRRGGPRAQQWSRCPRSEGAARRRILRLGGTARTSCPLLQPVKVRIRDRSIAWRSIYQPVSPADKNDRNRRSG